MSQQRETIIAITICRVIIKKNYLEPIFVPSQIQRVSHSGKQVYDYVEKEEQVHFLFAQTLDKHSKRYM